MDVERVQPVVEVLAESLFRHFACQIRIGRRNDADVEVARFRFADPADFVALEKTQKFDLRRLGKFADFVEEKRSSVGFLEQALLVGRGTRVGSLLAAEEFAFDEVFGNRAAVHGDKGFARPLGEPVDDSREKLLSGTGFPGDEDGTCRRRHLVKQPQNFLHPGRVPEKIFEQMVLQLPVAVRCFEPLQMLFRDVLERVDFDGLYQVGFRAVGKRAFRILRRGRRAEKNRRGFRIVRLEKAEHVDIAVQQKGNVDEGEIEGRFFDSVEKRRGVGHRVKLDTGKGPGLRDLVQKFPVRIGQQDVHGFLLAFLVRRDDFVDLGYQVLVIGRFGKDGRHAEMVRDVQVVFRRGASAAADGDDAGKLVLVAVVENHFETVLLRHDDVGDDDVVIGLVVKFLRFFAVFRGVDFVTGHAEHILENGTDVGFVVDDEYFRHRIFPPFVLPMANIT